MPKTRDAFALRGFDEQKIIARMFAPDFSHRTDAELLATYQFGVNAKLFGTDNQFATFSRITLIEFAMAASQYQTRLTRHNDRLLRYSVYLIENFAVDDVIQSRIRRARKLSDRYVDACRAVQSLQKKLHGIIVSIDNYAEQSLRQRFSERLREARKAVGLTQQQVADKIEMTASGYNQYELARRDPSIPTLIKIARILNRSADWLLGLTP